MNKIIWTIKGYASCLGWMLVALWKALLENCPDVAFWKSYDNIDDFLWYAERVNGRLAMVVLTTVLILELVSHQSIWGLIDGL